MTYSDTSGRNYTSPASNANYQIAGVARNVKFAGVFNQEGLDYIRDYFEQLFEQRNVDALDAYLDPEYFDDDIGDPTVNHIETPGNTS